MRAIFPLPARPGRNEMERQYGDLLNLQVKAGEILSWGHELVTFKLAEHECRYTPDFRSVVETGVYSFDSYGASHREAGCKVVLDELKGHKAGKKEGRWRPGEKRTVKVAMKMFPEYEWRVVVGRPTKNGYVFDVIPAAEALGRKKR